MDDRPFIRQRSNVGDEDAVMVDGVPVDLNRPSDVHSPHTSNAHSLLHNVEYRMASRKFFCENCQKEFTTMVNLNNLAGNLPRCTVCNG